MSHLVLTYGYLAVFGLITAEYIGVPVPGETALIVAAAYAGHTHRLSVWLILVLAVVAAILGDYLGYLAGLKGGYRLLLRWGPVIRLDHAKIKVGWYVFDRHGGKVVFFSRFVTVLRTYAAFLAGTNRMRLGRFSLFNMAGGVAWAVIYTFVSYTAGQLLPRLSTFITIIGLAVAAVMVTAVTLLMRRGAARLTARPRRRFPARLLRWLPEAARFGNHQSRHGPRPRTGEPLWMSDSQPGPVQRVGLINTEGGHRWPLVTADLDTLLTALQPDLRAGREREVADIRLTIRNGLAALARPGRDALGQLGTSLARPGGLLPDRAGPAWSLKSW